jgi:hypothetical protein
MTFTELVNEVMARTRQTSTEAQTRIGREVNDRYRRVQTTVGLQTSRMTVLDAVTVPGEEHVTFSASKVIDVWIAAPAGQRRMLQQITFNDWRSRQVSVNPNNGQPTFYAIGEWDGEGVRVYFSPVPDQAYTVRADAIGLPTALIDAGVPAFTPDFHDVIMYGALADEWTQLKQEELARGATGLYEQRLSELRYYIAKENSLAIVQGGRGGLNRGDYIPGYTVPPPGWYR